MAQETIVFEWNPVLFLDVDGVLNCEQAFMDTYAERCGRPQSWQVLDPTMVNRLDQLIDDTELRIVVSSTWRKMFDGVADFGACLRDLGGMRRWDAIKDMTGGSKSGVRGEEIETWLRAHPTVRRFAIVDDDADMGALLPLLVQTRWSGDGAGLQDEHCARLRELLK